ncbi:type II CAAX endopeptidase family protein [Paenibacillus sp. PK3_47]|uniref:CPBP family intramembrane glutamic endopeptidase n=1 Tax=Paenibacillus sp. PK3_47 TaxID=2072642 RepID=UPI00201E06CE|nr:type II CAAX endopeptidase family protein [Paenibacillus sp. PK3_47]
MLHMTKDDSSIFQAKKVPVWVIAGVVLLYILCIMFVNLVYFTEGYYYPLAKLTNGWVDGTLSGSLIILFMDVILFLLIIAKVPWRDMGLRKEKLLPGLTGFLLFWFALHIADGLLNFFAGFGSYIRFNELITYEPNTIFGSLFGQLFGNSLVEEIVFRGFLFVQLFLLFKRVRSSSLRLCAALLSSQVIFALTHIPNRIFNGYTGMEYVIDFFQLVYMGIIFCLLYWLTRNLFFVVGVHSLNNVKLLIWNSHYMEYTILYGIPVLVILLLLLKLIRHRSPRAAVHTPPPAAGDHT